MGKLVRTISADGSVMACAVDATDIVSEIEKIHQTSAVVSAALGRLASAASMMGAMLKGNGIPSRSASTVMDRPARWSQLPTAKATSKATQAQRCGAPAEPIRETRRLRSGREKRLPAGHA